MLVRRQSERGQALLETALFLPLALLVLFGTIYFSRQGVIAERTQRAMRYGAMMSFNSAQVYGVEGIYAGLPENPPSPDCPAAVVTDTIAGVTDEIGGGSPPIRYFRPDSTPTATCSISFITMKGGASFQAFNLFMASQQTVSAGVNVPAYLQPLLGAGANTTASMGYLHSVSPAAIEYCIQKVGNSVSAALNRPYSGGGKC